jgi:glycosyltransferase involved in cell wall biosynthesis
MKILQVSIYFNPKFGGDVNVCTNLSKELVKRSHEVTIVTSDYGFDPQYADSIRAEGVMVVPFPCVANFKTFIYSPLMKLWLEENLKQYDIIHLHNYRSYQNVIVHHFAMKYGIPYIVQAHGSVLPFLEKKRLKRAFDIVWGNGILKDTAQVIALTETEKNQYITMGVDEDKISIIPNGIDLKKYKQQFEKGHFKKLYNIPPNFHVILYLGRLHKSKGIDLLIESFVEINQSIKNIKLLIIGNNDGFKETLIDTIEKYDIKNDTILLNFINEREKVSAFFDADVFVTPKYYGFPITFLEACACGTPIVTTNNGDILEWIDNKVGFVVDYDRVSLANAIIKILKDYKLAKQFGDEGRSIVKERFIWNSHSDVKDIVGQYEYLYYRIR